MKYARDAEFLAPTERRLLEVESEPRKRGFGKTVLVVDDNALIRKILATAFLSDGFKTCGKAAN